MKIISYDSAYQKQVVALILSIQQEEYKVPITLEDQPDLLTISEVYQTNNSNFWIAIEDNQVIGSIALIDLGEGVGTLRKLFVKKDMRGNNKGIAKELLETLLNWSSEKKFNRIFLGTTSLFVAAHRFYEKNGFIKIIKEQLPMTFPLLEVDTVFYEYKIKK